MSKLLRKMMVGELVEELKEVSSFVVFEHAKMNAEQNYELRKTLRGQNVNMLVLKNRIANVVFQEIYQQDLSEHLKGSTAIAYGGESPADVAKAILDWNKKNDKVLNIKGALIPGGVLSPADVDALSKIPAKPVLLSMIAGVLEAPMQQVATILAAPMQDLSYAFNGLEEAKEKE